MTTRLERRAAELLRAHDLYGAPVDVEALAEREGITVSYERFRPDMSGMLVREPGEAVVIGVNSRQSPRRQRFTVAHELGHYVLHKGDLIVDTGARVNFRDERSATATVREEREANAFAAALLMPDELVEKAVAAAHGKASRPRALATSLALEFNVSEEAIGYRLLNLGFSSHA